MITPDILYVQLVSSVETELARSEKHRRKLMLRELSTLRGLGCRIGYDTHVWK